MMESFRGEKGSTGGPRITMSPGTKNLLLEIASGSANFVDISEQAHAATEADKRLIRTLVEKLRDLDGAEDAVKRALVEGYILGLEAK